MMMTIYLLLHRAAMDVAPVVRENEIKAGRAIPLEDVPYETGASYLSEDEDDRLYRLLLRRAINAYLQQPGEYDIAVSQHCA